MKIKSIRLYPFAGVQDNEVFFKNGLNIILGDNEAGKSTLFHAIQIVLFVQTKIRLEDSKLIRFKPVSGSDTIRIKLDFSINEVDYSLMRSWGGEKRSELKIGKDKIFTDDKIIQSQLSEFIGFSEGTIKNVFMSSQARIADSIDSIKKSESNKFLGDILKKSILNSGGLSIEKFKQNLEQKYDFYFSRWDILKNCPENNRGIENPYTRGVGEILTSYYQKEKLQKEYNLAKEMEDQIDEVNIQYEKFKKKMSNYKSYKDRYKDDYSSLKSLRQTELDIQKLELSKKEQLTDFENWTKSEFEISLNSERLLEIENNHKTLTKELEESNLLMKQKQEIDKYKSIQKRKIELDNLDKELSLMQPIEERVIKESKKLYSQIESIQNKIESQKFQLEIQTPKSIQVQIKKGLESRFQIIDVEREIIELIQGKLELKIDDITLKIHSLELPIQELSEQLFAIQKKYNNILEKYKSDNIEQLDKTSAIYQKFEFQKSLLLKEIEKDLNGQNIDEYLAQKKVSVEWNQNIREPNTIYKELSLVQKELERCKLIIETKNSIINGLKKKYKDKDELSISLGNLSFQISNKKQEMDSKKIPENFQNYSDFLNEYETVSLKLEEMKDEFHQIELKKTELMSKLPEESLEEIEKNLLDSKSKFEKTLKTAKGIHRIREVTHSLLEQIERRASDEYIKKLEHYFSQLTSNKYRTLDMNSNLPVGIQSKFQSTLNLDVLSEGTKDLLVIAVKLVMVDIFLRESRFLLVFDDPMINLDPERMKNAAKLLNDFSQSTQIIVLTCHPSHAKILEGNLIQV